MKRTVLNGISLRMPFVGAVATMVTEGDWRGGDADNPRAFFTRYQEDGDSGVQYGIGWLSIFRDPPKEDHTFVVRALGCAVAVRTIILAMMS